MDTGIILSELDCGDTALEKMMPLCPEELKPYILYREQIKYLFKPKIFNQNCIEDFSDEQIRAIFVARVSTDSKFQDPCSPFKQAMAAINLQYFDQNYKIIGVLLDFFTNGKKTHGRLLWDELCTCLSDSELNGTVPVFNSISFPEISRISRRASVIFDLAEHCSFYGLKLIEKNSRHDLADPKNINDLASKAADAQKEVYRMGSRMSDSKKYSFESFRTLPGKYFGFEVINTYDNPTSPFKRRIDSQWVRVQNEFAAYGAIFHEFIRNPNFQHVANKVNPIHNVQLSSGRVKSLLQNPHAVGIHFKPSKYSVINPETEKTIERALPMPPEIVNDLSPVDRPPFKYYIPEIVVIDLETYNEVQEIIRRKRNNIKPLPGNSGRGHRPARENGKSALSGLLICSQCGSPFVLYGPKGTRLFSCQGKRKHKCDMKYSVREDVILQFISESLEDLMIEHLDEFYSIYKKEFSKKINDIEQQISQLKKEKVKIQKKQRGVLENLSQLSTPGKNFFEEEIKADAITIAKINNVIDERITLIEFLKKDVRFDKKTLSEKVTQINELLYADPLAANEALKSLISAIEIFEIKNTGTSETRIERRYKMHISKLSEFFKSGIQLRNILLSQHQIASTERVSDIVETCSVEAIICANFTISVQKLRGGKGNLKETNGMPEFIWGFIPKGDSTCPVHMDTSIPHRKFDTTELDGSAKIEKMPSKQQKKETKPKTALNSNQYLLYSESLFKDSKQSSDKTEFNINDLLNSFHCSSSDSIRIESGRLPMFETLLPIKE